MDHYISEGIFYTILSIRRSLAEWEQLRQDRRNAAFIEDLRHQQEQVQLRLVKNSSQLRETKKFIRGLEDRRLYRLGYN